MEEDEFSKLKYGDLQKLARSFGIKANAKAEDLRNELKRVSVCPSTSDHPPPTTPSLPTKTPANVTRRRGPRAVEMADQTLADPLLSEDEESGHPVPEDMSAFMSEEEDEGDKTMADPLSSARRARRGPSKMETPLVSRPSLQRRGTIKNDQLVNVENPNLRRQNTKETPTLKPTPRLRRQRTFEKETPTVETKPRLRRQRTFQKKTPSVELKSSSVKPTPKAEAKPTLRRQRTFELESPSSESLVTPTIDGEAEKSEKVSKFVAFSDETDFSILMDDTEGLTDSELKARIMASIASADPHPVVVETSSVDRPVTEAAKSASKRYDKSHQNQEKGMESLVDFYARKRKRAEEIHKSAGKFQKSAVKVSASTNNRSMSATVCSDRVLKFGGGERGEKSANMSANISNVTAENKKNDEKEKVGTDADAKSVVGDVLKNENKVANPARALKVLTIGVAQKSAPVKRIRIDSPVASTAKSLSSEPRVKRIRGAPNRDIRRQIAPPQRIRRQIPKPTKLPGRVLPSKPSSQSERPSPGVFAPTVFSTKNINFDFASMAAAKSSSSGSSSAISVSALPVLKSTRPPLERKAVELDAAGCRAASLKARKAASTALPSKRKVKDASKRPKVNSKTSSSAASNSQPPSASKATITPGSRVKVETPGSRSGSRSSPWRPAGVVSEPFKASFNFGNADPGQSVFKFTATPSGASEKPIKKFDLKESLKKSLKYKPHRGPLRPFNDTRSLDKSVAANKKRSNR